jgi:uncharacterized membrane protein
MRLLDILIATLVVFPWLTEGLGIEVPGLHFAELSDLALPLLAASLVVLGVRRWPREAVTTSIFSGQGTALAQAWRNAPERSRARALCIAAVGLAALLLPVLLWRYWAFENPGFGLGIVVWKLTHGTGAVIVVALVGAAVQRWSGEPWERSFFVRQAMTLAQLWLRAVERSAARALWTAAAAVGAVFLWVSLSRHWAFETHGYDVGIFTNAIWNLTQGNGYVSSVKGGINLFSDHQSPLFWVLAPFFWMVPRPETLLFAQAFGLAAGGPALFYLARGRFGREHWAPAALPWLYWSWLPLRNANAFEFHPEVFMLPLFLWAFVAFAYEQRWVKALGVLALVGALAAKESAPVVAVGLGIAWALTSGASSWRERWPGLVLAAAGVLVFFFDVKLVPRIFGQDYAYIGLYDRFGGGIGHLLLAPFTQPAYFFFEILNDDRLNFLFWTLAPLGFLPLFCWRAALALLPPYLMLFLTEGNQRVQVFYHYGIEPGSALFWALPLGLAAFAGRFGWKRAGIWMLVWAIAAHGSTEVARTRSYDQFPHAPWLAAEVMPCLNTEAATAASDSLIPHLATRFWISYPHQLQQRPSGDPVRCVVTDLSVSNWSLERVETRRVIAELPRQGYREAWRCHDFRVYELETSGCLRCVPKCY